jgi:hypothetical protein
LGDFDPVDGKLRRRHYQTLVGRLTKTLKTLISNPPDQTLIDQHFDKKVLTLQQSLDPVRVDKVDIM